jgi:hypothetical protein
MNEFSPRYGILCPGEPCRSLRLKPDSHCHMPLQASDGPNPRLESTDSEFLSIREEILRSYDGLTEELRARQAVDIADAILCLSVARP